MGLASQTFTSVVKKAKAAGLTGLAYSAIVILALVLGFGVFALGTAMFQYCWNYLADGGAMPTLTFFQAAALRIVASHLFHSTTIVDTKKAD